MKQIKKPKPFPFKKCQPPDSMLYTIFRVYGIRRLELDNRVIFYQNWSDKKTPIAEYSYINHYLIVHEVLWSFVSEPCPYMLTPDFLWVSHVKKMEIQEILHDLNLLGDIYTINEVVKAKWMDRRRWRKVYRQYLKPERGKKWQSAAF